MEESLAENVATTMTSVALAEWGLKSDEFGDTSSPQDVGQPEIEVVVVTFMC